jgi:hypothetical protein
MPILRYTYVMRDQVRDKVRTLMRSDARGRRRRRHWTTLTRLVAAVVGLGRGRPPARRRPAPQRRGDGRTW